jgi:hypothetical protein
MTKQYEKLPSHATPKVEHKIPTLSHLELRDLGGNRAHPSRMQQMHVKTRQDGRLEASMQGELGHLIGETADKSISHGKQVTRSD